MKDLQSFDENYIPTDSRCSIGIKQDKHKENTLPIHIITKLLKMNHKGKPYSSQKKKIHYIGGKMRSISNFLSQIM